MDQPVGGERDAIWPEGIHAFDYFHNRYGRLARDSLHSFLNRILG